MRRHIGLWIVIGVVSLSVGLSAAFSMRCVECESSDSGTATGDGVSSVGTSNGTAVFSAGDVPSFASLGLKHVKDLRFLLTVAPYPTVVSNCAPAVPPALGECDYNAMNLPLIRFFVVALSPTTPPTPAQPSSYCLQVPSPCATIASVRAGEAFIQDSTQAVIYSAELVCESGLQLDLGETTSLQLTNKQWQTLDQIVRAVKAYDTNNPQFFVGFSVRVSVVDPNPADGVATKFVPFSNLLTIDTLNSKN